jgi:hypothetical protein
VVNRNNRCSLADGLHGVCLVVELAGLPARCKIDVLAMLRLVVKKFQATKDRDSYGELSALAKAIQESKAL